MNMRHLIKRDLAVVPLDAIPWDPPQPHLANTRVMVKMTARMGSFCASHINANEILRAKIATIVEEI